jgi:hypothetical protein
MATTLNLTETYDGELAGQILVNALITNESMQHVTLKEDIAYKEKVRKMEMDVVIGPITCDFTPTGSVTLSERELVLEGFQTQGQLCKKDFLRDWTARDAQNNMLNGQLQGGIGDYVALAIAAKNERIMWQGVDATVGEYNGFITLFNLDGTINSVASPVALTKANIIDKIELLLAEVPTEIENATEKPMVYMNNKTFHIYRQANVATGNGWNTYNGPAVDKSFMGIYDIVICPGMTDNTMVVAQKSNLWFGTNKASDMNSIKTKDMSDVDLSNNVRWTAQWFAGLQYGFGNEIALYTV